MTHSPAHPCSPALVGCCRAAPCRHARAQGPPPAAAASGQPRMPPTGCSPLRELRRVPQQSVHAGGRRRVDRHRLAVDDHGERGAEIRTSTPAFDARRSIIRAERARSRTSAPPAMCRWRRRPHTRWGTSPRSCAIQTATRPTRDDRLARDGVSCTVCHQIARDGLGTPRPRSTATSALRPARADGVRDDVRAVRRGQGPAHDHAIGDGIRAGRGAARPAVRALCDLPHAHHPGLRPRRPRHRIAAGADELPGMAPQRVLRRGAQLPELPHAAGRRSRSGSRPCSARSATACRGTRSSVATRSCSGC